MLKYKNALRGFRNFRFDRGGTHSLYLVRHLNLGPPPVRRIKLGPTSRTNSSIDSTFKTDSEYIQRDAIKTAQIFQFHLGTRYELGILRDVPALLRVPSDASSVLTKRHFTEEVDRWIDACLADFSDMKEFVPPPLQLSPSLTVYHVCSDKSSLGLELEFGNSKSNSLNEELLEELTVAFDAISQMKRICGVVLTGRRAEKSIFCGGASITTLGQLSNHKQAEEFINSISTLCSLIRNTPQPVVAAIDGPCIGAGLEIAASCDIRVGSPKATFSMPEVLLGIPSVVEARLLCEIVGWGRTRHLLLTGQEWNMREAYQAGLITKEFSDTKRMLAWTKDFLQQCLGARADVIQKQKALMRDWETLSVDDGVARGAEVFADCFVSSSPQLLKDFVQLKKDQKSGRTEPG
ncbi:hypothetical protein LTS08_007227 [Lithohypha guttulata]|uniref:Enoyl-CoA hydratase n=1 Tax=Lithohypha guttulata TaxID=1690604 RepID=A0AAN7T264_9EURO|nr:hypothetical protein LTR05_003982 [Lithohypha guttulata]KAK5097206.1 hypothetical protein LTS08_007227 [Lithohypha guttulata]